MRSRVMPRLTALVGWGLWGLTALAQPAEAPPERAVRTERYAVSYTVQADGSAVTEREVANTVLLPQGLDDARKSSFSYSTSVEKAEVTAAYTRKADSRRIDVPPGNYQVEVQSGKGDGAAAFSDETTTTVIFPEVAVGDTVVLAYRVRTLEPIFPGQFSTLETFPTAWAVNEARVRVDTPVGMVMQQRAFGMEEASRSEQGGRRVVEWVLRNPAPPLSKRSNYSVIDFEQQPSVFLSTFSGYADIARSYGARANPKAAVTPAIAQLADEIAPGKQAPRETARAIYDWVSMQIGYAGNCIGIGAVVPRDLEFVVRNRLGDCKDHATLMQALLTAKGIVSTQALVNAGNGYTLSQVPVVSQVNHVITYIPALDLFLDATARGVPFGLLPMSVAGKPVLLVDGYRDGLHAPSLGQDAFTQTMRTQMRIDDDGGVKGQVSVEVGGLLAAQMRETFRQLTAPQKDQMLRQHFQSMNLEGSGRINHDDPQAPLASFRYQMDFEVKRLYDLPGPAALSIGPLLPNPAPVAHYVVAAGQRIEDTPRTVCGAGRSVEAYDIELPKSIKVLALPKPVKLDSQDYGYRASYTHQGQHLMVRREFDDRSPAPVCASERINAQRDLADKAIRDLRAQVMYQPAAD